MPTVLRIGPYRFFFYSGDGYEPHHTYIERDHVVAKCWLSPVHLATSTGFRSAELRHLERLVDEHRDALLEAWNAYFGP